MRNALKSVQSDGLQWHGCAFDATLPMRAKGKPESVVVGAVANRWVRWLNHQMKENVPAAA